MPSKFEVNPMLRLRVKHASFTLVSSCLNVYFRAYAIIDFLADRLVFLNTVTNLELQKIGRAYTKEVGSFKCMSNIKLNVWDNRLVSENNILYYCFVTFYVERRCCHPI